MINHTCFKCKRRFELDPVLVGFELGKLKKKNPTYYQAVCPSCRAVNKVSISQMQTDLESVAEEVQAMTADYERNKAETRAARAAEARQKSADKSKK